MAKQLALLNLKFQGSPIRCAGTDRDLWFVSKDVAGGLGMVWSSSTLASIPGEWYLGEETPHPGTTT